MRKIEPCKVCNFSVILYYAREIAAPTPESYVNFPFVIQNYWKTANFAFYKILQQNFGILLILWCSFKLGWNFCLDRNFSYKGKGPLHSQRLHWNQRTCNQRTCWPTINVQFASCRQKIVAILCGVFNSKTMLEATWILSSLVTKSHEDCQAFEWDTKQRASIDLFRIYAVQSIRSQGIFLRTDKRLQKLNFELSYDTQSSHQKFQCKNKVVWVKFVT
jgi:hypothetical protein